MINDAGAYITNAPRWWHPHEVPQKITAGYGTLFAKLNPARKENANGLLLYGPPGTGKTSAGLQMLYLFGRAGFSARFQDFEELMIKIRSSWRKDAADTGAKILEEMQTPRILMLDDIGKRATPEGQEALSVIFNSRVNLGRPTICTTNLDLRTQQGEFDAACDSRVAERFRGCEVLMDGINLRERGK